MWRIRRTLLSIKRRARADMWDFAIWSLLRAARRQVYKPNGDAPVVYSPSPSLLDAISIFTLAEYCGRAFGLWNWCRKPRCVAVTDSVLINDCTGKERYCTDQRSISTNFQTIITIRTKECTQFYCSHNNIIKHQLLHVTGITGPASGSTQLLFWASRKVPLCPEQAAQIIFRAQLGLLHVYYILSSRQFGYMQNIFFV